MTDEIGQGQPVSEPSPAQEPAPAVEPTPQAPAVPEKLAGKSAEEIAAQYLELERKLGEQGRELGELRQRVTQPPPQVPVYYPPQFTQPEPKVEFDYGNPEASVERLVERRLERERNEWMAAQAMTREQEATYNYSVGKDAALKANPALYEGIEQDVEKAVQLAYRQYGATPISLRDPRMWERVAVNLRFERNELDKIYGKPRVQPPQPSPTGVPNQTRADARVGVELDDRARELARAYGLSEQEARDIIEKERELGGVR